MIESPAAAADDHVTEVAKAAASEGVTCITVTILASTEELEGDLSSRELIHYIILLPLAVVIVYCSVVVYCGREEKVFESSEIIVPKNSK